MTLIVKEVANDVVPQLRTPSEADIRNLIRTRASAATVFLYDPAETGEVSRDPLGWIARFIAADADTQWSIVSVTSHLTASELDRLQPAALHKACIEAIDFLRCVYSDERLAGILRDEAQAFLPSLAKVSG